MPRSISIFLLAAAGLAAGAAHATAEPAAAPVRVRVLHTQPLAPLDGRHLTTTVTEVTYEPGGSSRPHSHPCPVVVYVLEGAIRTRVTGEPEATHRAGDIFYEAAGGIHEVSANASDHARAKFLAIFVCDRDTPLTVPVPGAAK